MGEGFAYFAWRLYLLDCWAAIWFREEHYPKVWSDIRRGRKIPGLLTSKFEKRYGVKTSDG